MKPCNGFGFTLGLIVIVTLGALAWDKQWQKTAQLRGELNVLKTTVGERARLELENQRLRTRQIAPAELEALRADHQALPRLRAEVEALNKAAVPVR